MSFLVKRKNTYHLHVHVPARLIPTLGTNVLTVSLKTSSRSKARMLQRIAGTEIKEGFKEMDRYKGPISPARMRDLIRTRVRDVLDRLADEQATEYIKLSFYLCAEQLAQHRRIARVDEIWIEVVFGKIEKCQQAGESSTFGLGFATFGELVHEVKNVIRGQFVKIEITELLAKPILDERVGSDCIFFWNGSDDSRAKFSLLLTLS